MGFLRNLGIVLLGGLAMVVSGCGGPGMATPTPLPADVVRPVQNTPVFPEQMAIATPIPLTPTPTATPTAAGGVGEAGLQASPTPSPTALDLPSLGAAASGITALGIVGGSGATLADAPGGAALRSLAAGTTLNVTGRSADGAWLAAYTDDRVSGWVAARSVILFGAEGLEVVGPGGASGAPIPVQMPASPGVPAAPAPTPTSVPGATAQSDADGVVAVVQAAALNVRAGPGTNYPVVTAVKAGDELAVLGRNADLTWVRVGTEKAPVGYGWVSAGLVDLIGDIESIPISTQTSSEPVGQSAPAAGSAPASAGVSASAAGLQGVLAIQTSGGEIYAYNLATGALRRLTTGMDPAVSPDGSQVAFVRGGGEAGVYRMGIDGGGETRLFGGRGVRTPSWSPDGQYVVFSQVTGQVRCYDLGMGGCIPEGEAQAFFGSLPPSQQQQAQESIANGTIALIDRELRGLARVDRDGENYRDIPSLNTAYAPDWNSSGAIVYQSAGGLQITGDRPDAVTEPVTSDRDYRDPAWQPGYGRVVFHSQEGSHWEIFAINPDGTGLVALTRPALIPDGQSSSVSPAWSPDGKHIVFLSNRANGVWRLWVMDADGGNQRQLPVNAPLEYRHQGEQMVGWGG